MTERYHQRRNVTTNQRWALGTVAGTDRGRRVGRDKRIFVERNECITIKICIGMNKPIHIAFSTQKGGAGKTTLAVLVASYLHYVKGTTWQS